jgi:hypothetical protein
MVRAIGVTYDGNKTRRDACSAVGTVGARTRHAIPTMLALRRGSADDKSIATSPAWRNPGFAFPWPGNGCELRAGPLSFRAMPSAGSQYPAPDPPFPARDELASHVDAYQRSGDVGILLDQLRALAKRTPPEELKALAQEYREMPEVVIPLYERVVASLPTDAQAIVVLANAYWLTGRGPDVVGPMAARAKQIDSANRGAWHLWALAEGDLRKRVDRWHEVTRRFPGDQLARAALADNATSLAHDEEDVVALKLAITTYESLLAESTHTAQRLALEHTLETLRGWRF